MLLVIYLKKKKSLAACLVVGGHWSVLQSCSGHQITTTVVAAKRHNPWRLAPVALFSLFVSFIFSKHLSFFVF
jgi:hypothetical protein